MRLLGFIEVSRKAAAPTPRCGCGRPAIGSSGMCTRCRRTTAADVKRAGKSGKIANGPCPNAGCNRTVRSGVCPGPNC